MDFQHDQSWEFLTTTLSSKLPAKEAWHKFIDLHEQKVSKPYWKQLKELDIESEQAEIVNWLHQLVTTEPIPKSVVAIWIGIFKSVVDDKEIPAIYFSGAETYNKEDIDWACDPAYLLDQSYVQPELIQRIDDIARTDKENYEFFDWILPLAYCAFTFDEIIRDKLDTKLFLKNKTQLFVSVGHDSGDYIDLSPIK